MMLGIVVKSLKPVKLLNATCKWTQQLPTLLAQHCWELLRPFARSCRGKVPESFFPFKIGITVLSSVHFEIRHPL